MIAFNIVFTLLIPFLILLLGIITKKYPPKSINSIIGYRTSRSMINDETWQFAQKKCAELWIKYGTVIFLAFSLLCITYFFLDNKIQVIIMLVSKFLQVMLILASIPIVEKALKSKFNDDGTLK